MRGYRRALETQTTVQFEEFYLPLDAWFDVHAYPSADGLSVFFRDVTARRRTQEALRESEERFRTLGNSIPQLAWMADTLGSIFWYNDRWFDYTGTTLEEMQGWGWQKVHHPDHVDAVVRRIRQAFDQGTPWEDTFPLRSRHGNYRWFLSRALPIKDAHGQVVRWFGTNTDVTDERERAAERERFLERERELRAEAERRREELERVTDSRAALMRGFSHDVRNPLTVVDMNARLLEAGELSERQRKSIERIRRSVGASLRLIDDLLEVARVEAGHIEILWMDTDVAQVAREVAEDFAAPAEAAGGSIQVDTAVGLHTSTDPMRLPQVLGNLLSNAVKYAPQACVSVDAQRRRFGGPRSGDWLAVSVADTGPGIPPDKREAIFQEYTRLDPGATQPGTGIGLAISRRIARLLGGELTVESDFGPGRHLHAVATG